MPLRPSPNSILESGIEATFIPADPPRESWLALWSGDTNTTKLLARSSLATEQVELVTPSGDGVSRSKVMVKKLPLRAAIDPLVELDNQHENISESVRAWSETTVFSLGMIGKGSLQPALSATGLDMWRLGPFEQSDTVWQTSMAQALPPAARATPADDSIDDEGPTLSAAAPLVHAFGDAVADTFVRTAAAHIASGHDAFSSNRQTIVDPGSQVPKLLEFFADSGVPLLTLRIDWLPLERRTNSEQVLGTLTFQDRSDPSRQVPATALWAASQSDRKKLHMAESMLIRNLRRAVRVEPNLKRLLDQQLPSEITLNEEQVADLLKPETSQRLAMAGLPPVIPDNLFKSVSLKPILGSTTDDYLEYAQLNENQPSLGLPNRIDLNELVELHWQGSFDGSDLTDQELADLVASKRNLVRLRGEWVQLNDIDRTRLTERRELEKSTALAASLGGPVSLDGEVIDIEVVGPLAALGDRLRNRDTTITLEAPDDLKATLRPYQRRGLAWLREMDQLGLGGILADDMGLGKTVQVLALHLQRQADEPGPTLVVCPASVVGNWERETNKFSPLTKVYRYHSSSRSIDEVKDGDIVVTTYGIVRQDAETLASIRWGLVVADEAQAIKNPYSRSAQAIRKVPAQTRLALTGTPVQNQLSDLWALLDWTTPGLLGNLTRFRREIAAPIEKQGDEDAARRLNRQLRPFLLRRQKSDPDIAPELPPKTQTDEIVPLTSEQAALYQAVVSETMAEIRSTKGIERKGLVLRLLTHLKQICNHPAQFLKESDNLAGRSGKLRATTELLRVIKEEGQAALVFTQYVSMGNLLVQHLESENISTSFLNGSLSLTERDRLVNDFQSGNTDVFIVSLRAGGVGLNLTHASHVIHFDRWWNPAVEDQASDRAWRIGQTKPVQVHRLISEGTVEDRIAALLQSKRQLAESVVGSGESWLSDLTDEDLAELVTLSGESVDRW